MTFIVSKPQHLSTDEEKNACIQQAEAARIFIENIMGKEFLEKYDIRFNPELGELEQDKFDTGFIFDKEIVPPESMQKLYDAAQVNMPSLTLEKKGPFSKICLEWVGPIQEPVSKQLNPHQKAVLNRFCDNIEKGLYPLYGIFQLERFIKRKNREETESQKKKTPQADNNESTSASSISISERPEYIMPDNLLYQTLLNAFPSEVKKIKQELSNETARNIILMRGKEHC